MRIQWFVASFVLCFSLPALAQHAPKVDISGAFSFLGDQAFEESFQQPTAATFPGWVGSVADHLNPWFAMVGELGGNYRPTYRYQLLGSVNLQIHSYLVGPRFSARARQVTPFAHILVGATRFMAHVDGPNTSFVEFAVQPGGGVDFWVRPRVGIRAGGDYRRYGHENVGHAEFRGQVGIVLAFGTQ